MRHLELEIATLKSQLDLTSGLKSPDSDRSKALPDQMDETEDEQPLFLQKKTQPTYQDLCIARLERQLKVVLNDRDET